jgi:hypothetical protein
MKPDVVTGQPTVAFNMDFGGPHGSLLPFLQQVSIFTHEEIDAPTGLAFYYTNGSCKRYFFQVADKLSTNSYYSHEQGFSLDGPGGERIVEIVFEKDDKEAELPFLIELNNYRDITVRVTASPGGRKTT